MWIAAFNSIKAFVGLSMNFSSNLANPSNHISIEKQTLFKCQQTKNSNVWTTMHGIKQKIKIMNVRAASS